MSSITVVLEALDEAVESLAAVDLDVLSPPERFVVLERLETARRRQVAVAHSLVSKLERFEGCPKLDLTLADVLRVSPTEARRRLRDAAQLAPRTTLTGEPLPPVLPETAEAWAAGELDVEHLQVIQKFFRQLPSHVPPAAVEKAERILARKAAVLRPDQLENVAERLAAHLNPDGLFSDEDRARQRSFTWSRRQRPDGMSEGKIVADPETRALIDAAFAKFAAPGMCNPADETPTVLDEPTDDARQRDSRTRGQRQHDALKAMMRGQLGDPKLGQHKGLPVTVIVSATLQDLQAQTGHGVTAGGTLLPMSAVIRMASHA